MADYTKTSGQLMDWSTLDDTGGVPFLESSEIGSGENLDGSIECILHIDAALTAGVAGDPAYCSILIKSGITDEDWHPYISFQLTGGTANFETLNQNSGAGQANPDRIEVAATADFQTPGDKYYLRDSSNILNSCIVINKDYVLNDYIQVMDDLVNAYDGGSDWISDIVDQWNVTLPPTISAAKVIFYNTDADSNYNCKVRYTIVTEIG